MLFIIIFFLIVARVDLDGLFWQLICYGKNEITKPFSTSRMVLRVASYYIMVM